MKLKKAGGETAGLLATEASVSTHPSCLTQEMEKGQDAVRFWVKIRGTISGVIRWVSTPYDVFLGGHHAKQIRGFCCDFLRLLQGFIFDYLHLFFIRRETRKKPRYLLCGLIICRPRKAIFGEKPDSFPSQTEWRGELVSQPLMP